MALVPMVLEKDGNGERSFDLYSRLLRDRIIFIGGEIEPAMASVIVAELLHLDAEDNTKPIHLYVQSPGGECSAGFAIIDTMNIINAPVYTYCVGMCASMGAMIFSQGEKGHRYMLPNAEVMIHQPLGGSRGQASDIMIAAQNIQKTKERLYRMLAEATDKPYAEIEKACDRDYWLNAEESVDFHIADSVLQKSSS